MRIRSFRNEKRKQFYFRVYNSVEKQVLRSEAYNSKAARDNGIESFKKNAPFPERYERLTSSDGKYYFNIKAANHQIVATSLMFDSEDAQEAAIKEIIAYASSAGSGGSEASTTKASALNVSASSSSEASETANSDAAKEQDDYMDASFYQDSGTETQSGFDKFQKGDNNFYYFSFKSDDGKVLLTSQGYTQESGRDNGIASVEKNSPIEKRYTSGTTDNGKYFFTLKAGNHQEIARSVDFDSEDEMKRAMGIVMNGGGAMVQVTKAAAAPVTNNDDSKEQDDYMDVDFYQNSGTDNNSGFDKFQKGDNNFYYFSFKSDDGKVLLLSQGYTQESGRDNGIASVEKNSKIEKRYVAHTTDDGKYFFTLKAGNHQEIARSADFDSEDEMKRAMGILMNGGGAMVEVAKAAAAPAAAATSSKGDGMDDYRTFGFYKNSGTDVQNGWDKFYSEKHGEYYFSYKVDGEPVLISEGYTTEAARDNGIASVEKNWNLDKRYKSHETPSGRYYYTLRAGNHQEIARSKWYASADERDGGMKWLLGGGLGTMAAASTMKSSLISEEAPTVSEEVVEKTIETPTPEPAEKEDDYLPCKEYEGHEINDKKNGVAFFKHENGQYYFVVYKEDGSVRLRSEGFGSAKDRDVELSGMLKNLDNAEMYETIKRGKYSMHILRDSTGREVGRSCLEKEVEVVSAPVAETTVAATAVAAAAVSASSTEEKEVKTEKEDDYLPCKEYEGHEVNDKKNGVAFFKHENGQYYFVVYKEDGSVRLRSEGFGSAKDRDVELSGMLKNLDNAEMYETIKRGKYSMHILRDSTGREVGRSCLEKEVEKVAAPVVETTVAATAVAAAAVSASSTEEKEVKTEKEDDYLPCKEYEGHEVNDKVNNIAFFKHENGQYYFVVYKEDGSVRLRSEGFGSAKDRDVELSGVIKNLDNAEMYETIKRGKYSIHILRDSTGREVGRSCLEKEVEKVAAPPVVEAAAATAVAAAVVSSSSSEKEVKKEKEDDYLPCKAYEGHTVNDKQNNVAFFKHENGQFYFVVYKEDGSVRLRSEGFESAKERDVELSGLLKNIDNKEMYETLTRGKYRIHILRDKTGREVGRSCLETVEEKKAAPVVEAAAATAVAAAAVSTVKVEKEKEDDYLPCQEYQGHKVTDKKNNVAFFKKDGQFYFVIYKENGDVRLRSEGFKKSKRRDSELSAALKNLDNPDRYETLKRGKYSLHILKDETGREVGRSCLETEEVIVAPPIVETVAASAAAAAIVTETVSHEPEPEPEPEIVVEKEVVAPVVKEKVVAAAPVETAAAATAAASGGFNWMWLLPLLLLIPLFFMLRGCDGCGGKSTTATTAPPPVEKPVEKVTPPPAPVEKVTPPPAPTCNCNSSDNIVFNVKSGAAKVLTRLGTNPEFGNSHSLDPAGFYNKLKNAANSNQRDKRFLDGIFRAMGYDNGFADANAGLFSNARVPAGTVGNMGFSPKHRTVKARLNAQGRDLDAFKIKAANGCDLHFMKTCGNHFFFCPN